MRRFLLYQLFLWVGMARAEDISVTLKNPPAEGTVAFVLFNSPNTFGDLRDPFKVVRYPLEGQSSFNISDVAPGEYALMVYFDANGNDRIDRNFIGIPKEPLGFSNNYEPKGPPSYARAVFMLEEGGAKNFEVRLRKPLGDLGRLGVGVGVIGRSSPYRDDNGGVYQFIPALTYNGNRLQVFGPRAQVGLVGSGDVRLALTGQYRIGVYEENDSPFLEGLGDRENTFLAGLALQVEVPGGFDFSANYEHDVLDEIGGGVAGLSLKKSFQQSLLKFSPNLGVNWTDGDLANHDFGVPGRLARVGRPAYSVGDVISFEAGMGLFIDMGEDWLIVLNGAGEWLDSDVQDSPIVADDVVFSGFGAINYVF